MLKSVSRVDTDGDRGERGTKNNFSGALFILYCPRVQSVEKFSEYF